MPFSIGLNFRATSGYVTDPPGSTYVLGTDAYPTTRSGVTFGYESGFTSTNTRNRSTSTPILAGVHYEPGDAVPRFRVDLPSPGTYGIRLAAGDSIANYSEWLLLDDSTSKVASNTTTTDASQFVDASDTLRSSKADWIANNAEITVVFSSAILRIDMNYKGIDNPVAAVMSHLEIRQIASAVQAAWARGVNALLGA